MDLQFNTEQELLRTNLRAFLSRHYGFAARRAAVTSGPGWLPGIWESLCKDLGLLEAASGTIETMIVMEELGAALVVEPYLESAVVAGNLLARLGKAGLLDGNAVLSLAWRESGSGWDWPDVRSTVEPGPDGGWRLNGRKAAVCVAPWCSAQIVVARAGDGAPGLFLVDAGTRGLTLLTYATIDGRRAADLVLRDVHLPAAARLDTGADTPALLEWIADVAISALCAEAIGVMRVLLQQTLDYTRIRKQFGQAIADFQVIQHRLVDMRIQLELAASASLFATLSLDESPARRRMAAATAKVSVNQACRFVGQSAIQLHGGIGMTEECPISHYFRRCTAIEIELGGTDWNLARHAAAEDQFTAEAVTP